MKGKALRKHSQSHWLVSRFYSSNLNCSFICKQPNVSCSFLCRLQNRCLLASLCSLYFSGPQGWWIVCYLQIEICRILRFDPCVLILIVKTSKYLTHFYGIIVVYRRLGEKLLLLAISNKVVTVVLMCDIYRTWWPFCMSMTLSNKHYCLI